jgi:hypothetical protein
LAVAGNPYFGDRSLALKVVMHWIALEELIELLLLDRAARSITFRLYRLLTARNFASAGVSESTIDSDGRFD